jgi:hypothetical protein
MSKFNSWANNLNVSFSYFILLVPELKLEHEGGGQRRIPWGSYFLSAQSGKVMYFSDSLSIKKL